MNQSREALHSSKSVEWYTPAKYIHAVHEVMDWINLDPASCEEANTIVRAQHYFSLEHSGLKVDWYGKVYLNPPYGGETKLWVDRLIYFFTGYKVTEAILLVNATPDRSWFNQLWTFPICFTDHRIRFISGEGQQVSRPTHGNAFVYFGKQQHKFCRIFSQFGTVVERSGQC